MGLRAISKIHFIRSAAPQVLTGEFRRIVRAIWEDLLDDNCFDLAAQMSFYFSLSLFPFLIVLAALVGWLSSTNIWQDLARWITNYLPRGSRRLIFATIVDLTRGSGGFLSFGTVATIWTASSGFVSMMESLTVACGFKETRGFWKKRSIAVCATFVGGVFLAASFGILTFGHWAALLISVDLKTFLVYPAIWQLARWSATLVLILVGLSLIYYFLPNAKRPWRWITPGSAFVAITTVAGSAGFNVYLRHFGDYSEVYGTIAGFIVFMVWVYMTSLILLIGAETDSVMEKFKRSGGVA